MSDLPPAAMRKTDYISHNRSQWFSFAGFVGTLFILRYTARVVKFAVAIAGGATGVGLIVGIAVGVAFEWAIEKGVEAAMEWASDKTATPGEPAVKSGSPNVFINGLEAARGGPNGDDTCHQPIAEGSKAVSINNRPASREGDRTKCTGKLVPKPGLPQNVHFGGDPIEYDNRHPLQKGLELIFDIKDVAESLRNIPRDAARVQRTWSRGNTNGIIRSGRDLYQGVEGTVSGVESIWSGVTSF